MNKVFGYAKPYTAMITIAIVLLFVQANANLALPDYLSNIVNVGIQEGGIQNAVPEAIAQTEMDRTLLFMTEANQSIVRDNYTLITQNSSDYSTYLKDYPALSNQSVYVLNSVNKSETNTLNSIMAKPILIVYMIEQMMSNSDIATQMGMNSTQIAMLNQTFIILSTPGLPASYKTQIINSIYKNFSGLSDSMVTQAAVQGVIAQYKLLGMDTAKIQQDYLLYEGLMMLLVTLLAAACIIAVSYLSAKAATGMARDMREDLFKKVESFSSAELDKFSTASLVTRSTNDITQIQMVIMMIIRLVFYAPILAVGGIIHALNLASSMWWIIATAVGILFILIIIVFVVALPKFRRIQKLIDRINLVTRENLSGMMVIRSFNMQDFEEKRFDKANMDLMSNSLFINRVMVILMPFMMFIMNGVMVLIIWVGSHKAADGLIQIGNMMAFMQYAMQIVMSFLMISLMFIILPRAAVAAGRISDVLVTDPSIKDSPNTKKFNEPFNASIEFRNVSFHYPGAEEDALHNINFIAKPGQMTAFIGPTGAGKSTLVNLIPRFYDVTDGSILIDDTDIRDVTQHDLRDRIGFVPQKSSLFSGTIATNLYYANENATEQMIQSAVEISQAKEFVDSKPEGLDTIIAQGGMNVSGGQKQRLSIARAIVKRPPIYILDDSFSALDFKTDSALRKAFKENTGNSTLIIVTQRVSTIRNAEQIIVIDEGKIAGKGTHEELMRSCETYREIALSQHTMEELQ